MLTTKQLVLIFVVNVGNCRGAYVWVPRIYSCYAQINGTTVWWNYDVAVVSSTQSSFLSLICASFTAASLSLLPCPMPNAHSSFLSQICTSFTAASFYVSLLCSSMPYTHSSLSSKITTSIKFTSLNWGSVIIATVAFLRPFKAPISMAFAHSFLW